eukprot:6390620-Pyramimonas_sp.AAC.1
MPSAQSDHPPPGVALESTGLWKTCGKSHVAALSSQKAFIMPLSSGPSTFFAGSGWPFSFDWQTGVLTGPWVVVSSYA